MKYIFLLGLILLVGCSEVAQLTPSSCSFDGFDCEVIASPGSSMMTILLTNVGEDVTIKAGDIVVEGIGTLDHLDRPFKALDVYVFAKGQEARLQFDKRYNPDGSDIHELVFKKGDEQIWVIEGVGKDKSGKITEEAAFVKLNIEGPISGSVSGHTAEYQGREWKKGNQAWKNNEAWSWQSEIRHPW